MGLGTRDLSSNSSSYSAGRESLPRFSRRFRTGNMTLEAVEYVSRELVIRQQFLIAET